MYMYSTVLEKFARLVGYLQTTVLAIQGITLYLISLDAECKFCHSQWEHRADSGSAGCPDRVQGPRACQRRGYNTPFILDLQTVACKLLLAVRLEKADTQACEGICFRGEFFNSERLWGIVELCCENVYFLFSGENTAVVSIQCLGPYLPKNHPSFPQLPLNPTPSIVFIFLFGRRAKIKCS